MRIAFISFLLALFVPGVAFPNGPLRSIIVFGNEKTERDTILNIIGLEPQTYVTDKLVQEVDDRLVNAGLFKNVKVLKVENSDGTADLRITVVEKVLWFIFPVFQAWSGRYSGGFVFGENNLFVPNAATVFVVQGGNKNNRIFAAFDAKNIFDSSAVIRTWALGEVDDIPLYTGQTKTGELQFRNAAIAVTPGFQWTREIKTAVTFKYRRVAYEVIPPGGVADRKGDDVSIEFEFSHDSIRRRDAFLKGSFLKASYEFAETRFGTDYNYHIQEVEWRQAFQLLHYLNYVYEVKGSIGDETLPFHRQFTLGGSSLRGFADREFRGDTMIRARQDLLCRVLKRSKFSLFGAAFYDLGLLYSDANGLGRSALRNGAGGGVRVSLQDIIAPVFGLDFAYGIEDHSFGVLAAVGLVGF